LATLKNWEKVTTMKITSLKAKKIIEKFAKHQNIESQKDQNVESDLPMAFGLLKPDLT
jgi:hypothetical protein